MRERPRLQTAAHVTHVRRAPHDNRSGRLKGKIKLKDGDDSTVIAERTAELPRQVEAKVVTCRPRRETLAHPGRESLRTRSTRGPGSAPAITLLPSNANASLWIGLAPTARSSAA